MRNRPRLSIRHVLQEQYLQKECQSDIRKCDSHHHLGGRVYPFIIHCETVLEKTAFRVSGVGTCESYASGFGWIAETKACLSTIGEEEE